MITVQKNEEIQKSWLSELNAKWKAYFEGCRLKYMMELGEEANDFFANMNFVDVIYYQTEEGLVYETSTVRKFELVFSFKGEEYRMGAAEILGEGSSDWFINPEIQMHDNEHVEYNVISATDTTFAKEFQLKMFEEEKIQKVFREFELFEFCEVYERKVLDNDLAFESKELLNFFQTNKIMHVNVHSRVLEIEDELGNVKKFYLDYGSYANHF